MGECRGGGDCLIKLFGTTIPVPEAGGDAKDLQQHNNGSSSGSSSISTEGGSDGNKETTRQDTSDPPPQPEVVDAEDPKISSLESQQQQQQQGDDDDEASHSRETKLKKPDKVLPCPRCNSMDTKFCYFNNYNVNQPRHFCKNCQRYWTAGGAMRNVPVGAGRRKNKNAVAASHFLQRVRAALPAGGGDPLKTTTNGTVLSFGHGHGLAEQVSHSHLKEKLLIPIGNNKSVGPCGSEVSSGRDDDKNPSDIGEKVVVAAVDKPANGVQQQQHPAANMWPYGCAPSQAYYHPSGIAIPIFPAAPGYWGACMVPGGWSLPWPAPVPSSPTQGFSSSPTSCAPSVSSSGVDDSLTLLGKHARDGDEGRSSHGNGGKVWAPKSIRIDDADEVAKSSIWSLIGMNKGDKQQNANMDAARKHVGTMFESRHETTKTAKQAMMITSSPLLHANPVAFTRSLTFQEGS